MLLVWCIIEHANVILTVIVLNYTLVLARKYWSRISKAGCKFLLDFLWTVWKMSGN